MKIGFDFHNVLDAFPNQIGNLILHLSETDEVHVISAIGPRRKNTIANMTRDLIGTEAVVYIHEVVFKHPSQSPALKTAKALELGLQMFFDDRQDVCDAMNAAGILCFKVPRDFGTDISADFN